MQALATRLSSLLGFEVEFTARTQGRYTLSAEGNRVEALRKALKGYDVTGHQYDAEDDFTCVYFEA